MTKSQNTKNEQQKDLCITVEKQVWESTLNRSMVLEAENTKLKGLLKECRTIFDYAKDFAYHDPCCKCIDKINQALGEDK